MKFNRFAYIGIVAALMAITSGCQSKRNDQATTPGLNPVPGYSGGLIYGPGVQPGANGSSVITFNGTSVYADGVAFSGGSNIPVSPYGTGIYGQPKFCATVPQAYNSYQTYGGYGGYNPYSGYGSLACYEFLNALRTNGSGNLGMGPGSPGANLVTIQSRYYPGTQLQVAHVQNSGDPIHFNVNGMITLSSQLLQQIQASPPAGWPNIVGVAYDAYTSGGGGMLIYTSAGHGFFVPL